VLTAGAGVRLLLATAVLALLWLTVAWALT
jgi:hypothetical protein